MCGFKIITNPTNVNIIPTIKARIFLSLITIKSGVSLTIFINLQKLAVEKSVIAREVY